MLGSLCLNQLILGFQYLGMLDLLLLMVIPGRAPGDDRTDTQAGTCFFRRAAVKMFLIFSMMKSSLYDDK